MKKKDGSERKKRESAPMCQNCQNVAGLQILMKRQYQRVDGQWDPSGWLCPNCFEFCPDVALAEARERSRSAVDAVFVNFPEPRDEEDVQALAKYKQKVQVLLQSIYNKS